MGKGVAKKIIWWAILAIIIVIALIVVGKKKQAQNSITLKTQLVTTGAVKTSITATGQIEPLATVEVKSNVGGELKDISVNEGDRVTAGQVIAHIDAADASSSLEQSKADLDSANAKVAQAQESLTMQQKQYASQLTSAIEAVSAAKNRLAQAETQAKLQPQLTDNNISSARSALAAAQTSHNQLKDVTIPQQILAARTALEQAKANYKYADSDLQRQNELLKKGYVAQSVQDAADQRFQIVKAQLESAQDKYDSVRDDTAHDLVASQSKVDQASTALSSAEANRVQDSLKQQDVDAARIALRQAQASQDSVKAAIAQIAIKAGDITTANAGVKKTEASVSNARTQLGYTTITAPSSGIVMKKYVEKGTVVAGGKSNSASAGSGVTLLDIADMSKIYVTVNIDETDIAQVSVGQAVEISVDAYADDLFNGQVTKIAPSTVTEQNITTIPVTVEISTTDERLKPGMNATCDFITGRTGEVVLVPTAALSVSKTTGTVLVLEKGKPVIRKVQTGLADNSNTQIIAGLQAGEVLITEVTDPQAEAAAATGMSGGSGAGSNSRGGSRMPGGMPMGMGR